MNLKITRGCYFVSWRKNVRKEEAGVEGLLPREPNGDSIQKTGDVLLVVMM